jgi:hypothetical protein
MESLQASSELRRFQFRPFRQVQAQEARALVAAIRFEATAPQGKLRSLHARRHGLPETSSNLHEVNPRFAKPVCLPGLHSIAQLSRRQWLATLRGFGMFVALHVLQDRNGNSRNASMDNTISAIVSSLRWIASAFVWAAAGGALLAPLTLAAGCWYAFVRMILDGVTPDWGPIAIQFALIGAAAGGLFGFCAQWIDGCNPFASNDVQHRATDRNMASAYVRMSRTTSPYTSVSRKSRPA